MSVSRRRARDPRGTRATDALPDRDGRALVPRTFRSQQFVRGSTREADKPRSDDRQRAVPQLTPEIAHELALMLHAGLEPFDALHYILPDIDSERLISVAKLWAKSAALFDAVNELNGGAWQTLEPQKRYEIALDKHYAELARFLYTRSYADLVGKEFDKAVEARRALEAKIAGRSGSDDPLTKFARHVLGKMTSDDRLPPQLTSMVDTLPGRKPS